MLGNLASKTARSLSCCAVALGLAACASPDRESPSDGYGVLVMAHRGSAEWDQGVLDAVAPLRRERRVEVAFGMADADTIQRGVAALEAAGARRIGVVRLFVSGESWTERTEQILGVRAGAPARPETPTAHEGHEGHGAHAGHSMAFYRIDARADFALSREGLVEAPAMGGIVADRAAALSREPAKEDVLVLAHGPGDDDENARWIAHLDRRVEAVRTRLPFRRVEVQTLREDWPEKRQEAEERIRAFVRRAAAEGGRALVIPFRVQGFGPYAEVLAGLDYVSDGQGLVPDPRVTEWIAAQASLLEQGPFRPRTQVVDAVDTPRRRPR